MLRKIAYSERDKKCLLSANIEQSAEPPLINSFSSTSVLLGVLSSLDITCQGLCVNLKGKMKPKKKKKKKKVFNILTRFLFELSEENEKQF